MLVEVDVGEIHKGILTLHAVFDAPNCLQQTGETYCQRGLQGKQKEMVESDSSKTCQLLSCKGNVEHGDCAMKATRRICR